MRLCKAISACAVSALAMVFSVQQGEHGPLVTYKLKVPQHEAPASGAARAPLLPKETPGLPESSLGRVVILPAPAPKLSPLEPTVLGRVAMPARHRESDVTTYVLPSEPPLASLPSPTVLDPLAFDSLYREILAAENQEDFVNEATGEALTLDEVNEAVSWRRDTAEKLRQVPVAPRF